MRLEATVLHEEVSAPGGVWGAGKKKCKEEAVSTTKTAGLEAREESGGRLDCGTNVLS